MNEAQEDVVRRGFIFEIGAIGAFSCTSWHWSCGLFFIVVCIGWDVAAYITRRTKTP